MLANRDWLLLALSQKDNGRMSPAQIQKCMFLMKEEASEFVGKDFYIFTPYNYGPFNPQIYSELDSLATDGLILIDKTTGNKWPYYQLTLEGYKKSEEMFKIPDSSAVGYLAQVVEWVGNKSFPDLIRAIYKKYPAYKKNSVFGG